MNEALYYEKTTDGSVHCLLCPQSCRIGEGKAGFCRVRRVQDQQLRAENYGEIASIALDPIEKKPLYHFYPGRMILSVGTIGCNLACVFCQNWQISRESAPTRTITVAELVALAIQAGKEEGSIGLAYTYSEPGVWYEFIRAVMPRIREQHLQNVLVTNAFLQPEPWRELLAWTDAANIDLKGFTPEYYAKMCHGRLEPVLENIRAAVGRIHVELTTLLIPGENDRPEQIRALAQWIAGLDSEIPLHLSRYFPNYQLTIPATSLETMEEARAIASEYLHYVYLGNAGVESDTHCPDCGGAIVRRRGYRVEMVGTGTCPGCGRKIPLILEDNGGTKRN